MLNFVNSKGCNSAHYNTESSTGNRGSYAPVIKRNLLIVQNLSTEGDGKILNVGVGAAGKLGFGMVELVSPGGLSRQRSMLRFDRNFIPLNDIVFYGEASGGASQVPFGVTTDLDENAQTLVVVT